MRIIMFIALACMAWAAHAEVPHVFQPGQPARAADVNQNFKHLSDKTNQSITYLAIFKVDGAEYDDGIAEAVCPVGSIPASANCHCFGDGTSQNFGVVMGCRTTTIGALGACAPAGVLFNPSLSWPTAIVSAMCASAETHGNEVMGQATGIDAKIQADDHAAAANQMQEQTTILRALVSQ